MVVGDISIVIFGFFDEVKAPRLLVEYGSRGGYLYGVSIARVGGLFIVMPLYVFFLGPCYYLLIPAGEPPSHMSNGFCYLSTLRNSMAF